MHAAPLVDHPLHGPGRVMAYQRGGRLALVEFQSLRLPTLVPVRELIGATDILPPAANLPGPAIKPPPALVQGTHDRDYAAQALEAMRLGVVPDHDLSTYTVGRKHELDLVDADLRTTETDGGQVRAFLADYGVGKTHLLEMISQRALAAGYLTASVVLDAAAVAPSHPKRVYRALVRSLKYPDRPLEEGCGLAPLLERAARSERALQTFAVDAPETEYTTEGKHLYLTAAIAYMRALLEGSEDVEDTPQSDAHTATADPDTFTAYARKQILDWIEGHPTISSIELNTELKTLPGRLPHLFSLSDYRPWARIYSYLISGISTLARQLGYAGLVLTVDEAELYTLLSSENREFATILFKALSCASLGPENIPFDATDLNLGGRGVLRHLPPRYGAAPGLYTVFAMTPNEAGIDTMYQAIPRAQSSEISTISSRDYDELTTRVCDFYASARDHNTLDQTTLHQLTTLLRQTRHSGFIQNPREAMKLLIELLDIHHYHPEQLAGVITDLQRKMF